MKTSTTFFTILILLLINCTFAQETNVDITFDSKGILKINALEITGKTSSKDLIKEIGEPSRKSEEKNGQVDYFYEEIGIVIGIKQDRLQGIGINFNWDGDKKFPKKSFTGTLSLGDDNITIDSKNEDLSAIEVLRFDCPIPMMCVSKSEKAGLKVLVGFNSEKAISQFVFMLK